MAVADDSTATWWNPGAMATGPFVDAAVGIARTDRAGPLVSRDAPLSASTVTTPGAQARDIATRITDRIRPGLQGKRRDPESGRNGRTERSTQGIFSLISTLGRRQFGEHVIIMTCNALTLGFCSGGDDGDNATGPWNWRNRLSGGHAMGRRFDLDIEVMAVAGLLRLLR